MKKALAAVLSICMVLSMAGCGESKSDSTTSKTERTTIYSQPAAGMSAVQPTMEAVSETTTSTEAETTPPATEPVSLSKPETNATEETAADTAATSDEAATTTAATTKAAATTAKTTAAKKKTAAKTTVTTTKPKPAVTTTKQTASAPSAQKKKINYSDTSTKLFYITKNTNLYDLKKNHTGAVYAGSLYTGHYDANYKGYVVIDYLYGKSLVADVSVTERSGAKILSAAAIGQMGGSIYGQGACGPTAAAILVNGQLGLGWSKDELIKYCESKRLNDQGSLRFGGGITAPNLIKAINGFSGGKVTASNVYGADSSSILKGLIDSGERSIVVMQYRSGKIVAQNDASAHFVVICGYEYIGGALYFYYTDPYYSYGGRSLMRVSAATLAASMSKVTKEPRCIITVKGKGT